MRKLLSILALFCLLFLTAGYHVLYQFRLAEAKAEMKRTLLAASANCVIKRSFSEKEMAALEWESATEFSYQGEMYDVIKVEKEKAQTIVWCLSDEKETALVHNYLKTQKRSSESSSGILLKLLSAQYLPSAFSFLPNPISTATKTYSPFHCALPDAETLLVTPPPQVC